MPPDTDLHSPLALIVDDDVDLASLLAIWLPQLGYRVAVADRLESALAALRQRPQLVLLDLLMPEQCSERLEQHLTALDVRPRVYFMSSAPTRIVDRRRRDATTRGLPVAGILRKPFNAAELENVLRAW